MNSSDRQTTFLQRLDDHRGIILKVAAVYCRSRADRQDLAQEIIVQLWRSYHRFDESRRFSTWMYRVAVNVAISYSRRQTSYNRNFERSQPALLETIAAPADESFDEDAARLHEFIAHLDDLNRALMILYLDDIPYAEIAEILGLSETNVATKLSRIKQKLKHDIAGASA